MQMRTAVRWAGVCLAVAALIRPTSAATLYWDANGGTSGTGGTGAWNTSSSLWRGGSATGTLGVWANPASPPDAAFFGGTAGTVTIADATVISANGLTFDAAGYTLARTGTGRLSLAGTSPTISVTTGTATISSVISGTDGFVKTGAGQLTLSGANTVSGPVSIGGVGNVGVVLASHANALGSGSAVTVESGYQLQVGSGITLSSTNTLALNGSGGSNVGSGGALYVPTGTGTVASPITLGAGDTRIGASGTNTATLRITGKISSGTMGRLVIRSVSDADGTVLLEGANDYTGGTYVLIGTLKIAGGNDRLPVTTNLQLGWTGGGTYDARFDLNGRSQRIAGLARVTGTNTTAANSIVTNTSATLGTLTLDSAANSSYDGVVAGTLALAKAGTGTLALTGSGSYTGGTTVTAGTLSFASGSLGSSGTITMNGGSLRWETGNIQNISSRLALVAGKTAIFDTNGNTVTFGSAIGSNASASLEKTGAGSLTLSGSNSFTGQATVTGGTLGLAAGASLAASALAVGTGARLDVASLTGGLVLGTTALSGSGELVGSVAFGADSKLAFGSLLTIDSGTVTFNGFGIDDILGLDGSIVSPGTYTLLGGTATFDLTNALNVGAANAVAIGGGSSAYLEGGGLQVVVVPEPAFGGLVAGLLAAAVAVARTRGRGRGRGAAA
jgi:fibronectin-binding autotransporter adhesin